MVVACIARNRTCLNGLAKAVDDAIGGGSGIMNNE